MIKPLLVVFTALGHWHLWPKTNILTSIMQLLTPTHKFTSCSLTLPQVWGDYHVVVDIPHPTFPVQDSSVDGQIDDDVMKSPADHLTTWKIIGWKSDDDFNKRSYLMISTTSRYCIIVTRMSSGRPRILNPISSSWTWYLWVWLNRTCSSSFDFLL